MYYQQITGACILSSRMGTIVFDKRAKKKFANSKDMHVLHSIKQSHSSWCMGWPRDLCSEALILQLGFRCQVILCVCFAAGLISLSFSPSPPIPLVFMVSMCILCYCCVCQCNSACWLLLTGYCHEYIFWLSWVGFFSSSFSTSLKTRLRWKQLHDYVEWLYVA